MKTTPKIAEALVNLRGNRDFAVVLEGLGEHVKEELQHCADYEGVHLHRAQGAAKAIQWWQKAFETAPKDFEMFKQGR